VAIVHSSAKEKGLDLSLRKQDEPRIGLCKNTQKMECLSCPPDYHGGTSQGKKGKRFKKNRILEETRTRKYVFMLYRPP
jgi:hypothetical protein